MGEGACNISATSLVADFAAHFSCELLNSFQLLDCIFRKKAFLYLFDVGWNGASQFVQFACSVRQFRCVLTFDVRPCIRKSPAFGQQAPEVWASCRGVVRWRERGKRREE